MRNIHPPTTGSRRRAATWFLALVAALAGHTAETTCAVQERSPFQLYEEAEAARKEGEAELARRRFVEALAARPDHVEAHVGYQKLLQSQGKETRLVREYRDLLESRGGVWYSFFLYGRLLHDPEREEELYRRGLEKKPASYRLRCALASALERQGRYEEAVREYHAAKELQPDSLELHADYMYALLDAGKKADLLAEYRELTEKRPGDARALMLYGIAAEIGGDEETAGRLIRRAAAIDPEDLDILEAIATIELKTKNIDRAQEIFERLHSAEPYDHTVLGKLGLIYCVFRRDRKGLELLRRAVRLEPANTNAFRTLAMAHVAFAEFDAAERALREALRLGARDDQALYQLAGIFRVRGRHEEAATWVRKAIEVRPDEAAYHSLLAACYRRLGDFDAEREALTEARAAGSRQDFQIVLSTRELQVRVRSGIRALELAGLAVRRLESGDYDGAEEAFREAAATDPGCFRAQHGLAMLLERLGRRDEALERYRLVMENLCGEDESYAHRRPQVSLRIARCLYELGRVAEALALYRSVWKEHGDSLPRSNELGDIIRAMDSAPSDAGRYRIDGLRIRDHAAENYCFPEALDAVLRHWDLPSDLEETGRALVEEDGADLGRALEYVKSLEGVGSVSFTARAGVIKRLLERGYPVILLHFLLHDGEYDGHASVIAGYDERLGVFTLEDSNWFAGQDAISFRRLEGGWGLLVGPAERVEDVEAELPDREFWRLLAMSAGKTSEEAGKALDGAVKLRPDAFLARFFRGWFHLREGRAEAGAKDFRACAALPGADARADFGLGVASLQMGRDEEAEAALLRAVAAEPDYAGPRRGLLKIYTSRGEPERALPHLERLLEIDPDNAGYHFERGRILRDAGREDEALDAFLFAAAFDGPRASLSQAAFICIRQQNYESAKPLVERYLELSETEEERRWAREMLEYLDARSRPDRDER